jgi:hypothetical protein
VKNASGLSVPRLTVLWPDERKSIGDLADRKSADKYVDESYMVSVFEGRAVGEGEKFGG